MPLFLIRHPRPLIESGVCYGRLDVEADNPQALAARLAPRLPSGLPIISADTMADAAQKVVAAVKAA